MNRTNVWAVLEFDELPEDKKNDLAKVMEEYTHSRDIDEWDFDGTQIWFRECQVRFEDDMFDDLFAGIEKVLPIQNSSFIEFQDDEDNYWKWRRQEGQWVQFDGAIVYTTCDEPSYEDLRNMFVAYVMNDSEQMADREYIRHSLEQCGCTEKYRKALGLAFPVEGGEA